MTQSTTESVLDVSILCAMYGEDSPEFIAEILQQFQREAQGYIALLEQALVQIDYAEVVRLSHSLKSMCGLIGALQLGMICQQLEQTAVSHNFNELTKLSDALTKCWLRLQINVNLVLESNG
jgi:HPt (histidine-containing phosphotransfer) domain-containing protein